MSVVDGQRCVDFEDLCLCWEDLDLWEVVRKICRGSLSVKIVEVLMEERNGAKMAGGVGFYRFGGKDLRVNRKFVNELIFAFCFFIRFFPAFQVLR